jgi:uncharacterized protein YjlB
MLKSSADVDTHWLTEDGSFPNNGDLPLLVYRQALELSGPRTADQVQQLIESNRWGGTWQNGVFPYHHYHSNAHEVLAVCGGEARVQFGGPDGPIVSLAAGDVALLPAGTAHKKVDASPEFLVVGGYPAGQEDCDLIRDDPDAKKEAQQRIAKVPLPDRDPLYGDHGPMQQHWTA